MNINNESHISNMQAKYFSSVVNLTSAARGSPMAVQGLKWRMKGVIGI